MPTWIIEPRDPLIVRDGRPFGPDPGARARSLPFPFPSTTAGGVRNRAGSNADGMFDLGRIDDVKQIAVRGPLLVELTAADSPEIAGWFAPMPADALAFARIGDTQIDLVALQPLVLPAGAEYGRPQGPALALVGPRTAHAGKPLKDAPRFWNWQIFTRWLEAPADGPAARDVLGVGGLATEFRMHVAIDAATQAARESFLFQTSGLEFTGAARERLALAVVTAADLTHAMGLAPLGGERRLMVWRPRTAALPSCPSTVRQRIKDERGCRVILLTPAWFVGGYRPGRLLDGMGLTTALVGAAVGRPQVVSGWNMVPPGPKPTRRLAPAGSVYFLALPAKDAVDDATIDAWIDAVWMQSISDDAPSCADGFGLAALGTWDGRLATMEVQ
jgi:CRISPR-associated protein Cmr3